MITEKIKLELQKKLIDAQHLLSDVYDYACEHDLSAVERQMSCADDCIIEAIDALGEMEK
jgi:hypothetical protein